MQPDDQLIRFLQNDCLTVAPELIGCELVSYINGQPAGGRIMEVEAYHGERDPASHAFRGRTTRTEPMFQAGGVIYVYLSYGLHHCVNLVTGPAGEGQAVLIRALEPTIGLEVMTARRGATKPELLTTGPGRVGQALGLRLQHSGSRLGEVLELRPQPAKLPAPVIARGPRIGISRAKDHPWRFWLAGSRFVSHPRVWQDKTR
jgi:DNA-3-methyladenine glycosylase